MPWAHTGARAITVQVAAGAGVQKLELRHVDVALEHIGVVGALVVGQFAQGVGAGDVGGAVQILAAAVHQQKAPGGQGGAVAGGGRGSASWRRWRPRRRWCRSSRRCSAPARPAGPSAFRPRPTSVTASPAAIFSSQPHLELHHGHAVLHVGFFQVLDLHGVFTAFSAWMGSSPAFRVNAGFSLRAEYTAQLVPASSTSTVWSWW